MYVPSSLASLVPGDTERNGKVLDLLNADGLTIVIITHDATVAAHAGRTVAIGDGILSEQICTGHG